MMKGGANMYIRHTTPNEKPTEFSPEAKQRIATAHNASVKTVKVTKSTVGKINNVSATPRSRVAGILITGHH